MAALDLCDTDVLWKIQYRLWLVFLQVVYFLKVLSSLQTAFFRQPAPLHPALVCLQYPACLFYILLDLTDQGAYGIKFHLIPQARYKFHLDIFSVYIPAEIQDMGLHGGCLLVGRKSWVGSRCTAAMYFTSFTQAQAHRCRLPDELLVRIIRLAVGKLNFRPLRIAVHNGTSQAVIPPEQFCSVCHISHRNQLADLCG